MKTLRKMAAMLTIFTIVVSIVTFILPEINYGATCTADCGGGNSVSCSGAKCSATDGSGCSGYDSSGKLKSSGKCLQ